ncbi:hypothetical protein K505DRAFT_253954 [Melanomma pulvis-pyrius CBS 109.77]|uniref:Rhodopsin domain-containing protein n=1 Tax=Melanomma pulvis-pyrius CBS 109.77 TaxID=1314802 RepID=A0A6A6WYY3_9PLEO|nr:hypothetical protein K505DRAFT_253954 [Melanomma pulvis-pyrius CBS 109.77]
MVSTSSSANLSLQYRNESRGSEVVAASVLFIVLGTVFTLLRAWARFLQVTPFLWGDVLVPIGLVFLIATSAVAIAAVEVGNFGRHTKVIWRYYPESLALNFQLLFYALPCLYCFAITFPKLAILNLYIHVCREPWMRWASYGITAITIISALVNLFTTIFQCTPIDQLWNPSPKGHCMNIGAHFQWASFPNIFTDVAILIVPIPMVLKLEVPMRLKVGVAVTFFTGSIGLVASIARFASFNRSTAADPFWDSVPAAIWTVAEPGIYLIAACLVTLKPLINYIFRESRIAPAFSKNSTSRTLSSQDEESRGVKMYSLPGIRGGTAVAPASRFSKM